MISRTSGPALSDFGAATETIRTPSSSRSASARTTSPTLAPEYNSECSRLPFGSFAPAARHVHTESM